MKSRKIYDHIAHDIKDLIANKNMSSGGYVMPKLINLNYDHYDQDRKSKEPQISIGNLMMPQRRANQNIFLYSHQNE